MPDSFSQDNVARSYREAADLDAQAAEVLSSSDASATAPADFAGNPLDQLCPLWRRIRPIVEGASNLFFIPANIRAVLKQLIGVLDLICPG